MKVWFIVMCNYRLRKDKPSIKFCIYAKKKVDSDSVIPKMLLQFNAEIK